MLIIHCSEHEALQRQLTNEILTDLWCQEAFAIPEDTIYLLLGSYFNPDYLHNYSDAQSVDDDVCTECNNLHVDNN